MSIKQTIIAVSIMILTFAGLNRLNHSEDIVPNKPFSTFPKKIGQWSGEESRFDRKIYEILGVDDSYLANYRGGGGQPVQIYIGFYQSQREGNMIHSPKNCMPGSGWNITGSSVVEVETPGTGQGSMTAIKLVLQNGPEKMMALYWFQSRGRIIASEYLQKVYLVVDSIIKHRTDGSFVRLTTPIIDGDEKKALEILKGFTRELMPLLNDYIPA